MIVKMGATTQVDHEERQVHCIRNSGFSDDHKVLQAPVSVWRPATADRGRGIGARVHELVEGTT